MFAHVHAHVHLLGQSAGKLSTGVCIKPSNVLPQNGSVEQQPNLAHLALGGKLVQHDLDGSHDKDPSCDAKEDIHLRVDNLNEVVISQAHCPVVDAAMEEVGESCAWRNHKGTERNRCEVWGQGEVLEVGGRAVHISTCKTIGEALR